MSVMVSCSVAQAKHLVKAGVYVMPARHDQESAHPFGLAPERLSTLATGRKWTRVIVSFVHRFLSCIAVT